MLGAAAGVGVAASLVTGARPAGAADGCSVIMGTLNNCTNTTAIGPSNGIALVGIGVSDGLPALEGSCPAVRRREESQSHPPATEGRDPVRCFNSSFRFIP